MTRVLAALIASLLIGGCMTAEQKDRASLKSGPGAYRAARQAPQTPVAVAEDPVLTAGDVRLISADDRARLSCSHLDSIEVVTGEHASGAQNRMVAQSEIRQRAAAARGNAVIINESALVGNSARASAEILRCSF